MKKNTFIMVLFVICMVSATACNPSNEFVAEIADKMANEEINSMDKDLSDGIVNLF